MVNSIYDPLGFLSPVILTAKSILQELCRIKMDWNGKIPEKHLSAWLRSLEDFLKLSKVEVDISFNILPNLKFISYFAENYTMRHSNPIISTDTSC